MEIPTVEQQQQIKAEADEIRYSILQKREHRVPITSSNTQRFIDEEIGSVLVYFVIAGLLLLGKFLKPNPVSVWFVIGGFSITIIILFIFAVCIIKLRQKQEDGTIQKRRIIPILSLCFIPYIFGLYLILVVGVFNLVVQFSIIYFPQAVAYSYLGYSIIKKVKILQELGIRISENK